jgi:hypothetical protein
MAFKFKDLMINVTSGGGGVDDPICTLDTMKEPPPAGQAATCTVDTMPAQAARGITCTVDTMDPALAVRAITCTVDTMFPYGFRPDTGRDTGICTIATMAGTIAALTTVTTVTTLVQAASPAPASLAQLKEQLQQALADVERREREQQDAQALPKTLKEADDLERRLQGALQELRDHRKTLEKGAKKEAPKPSKGKK